MERKVLVYTVVILLLASFFAQYIQQNERTPTGQQVLDEEERADNRQQDGLLPEQQPFSDSLPSLTMNENQNKDSPPIPTIYEIGYGYNYVFYNSRHHYIFATPLEASSSAVPPSFPSQRRPQIPENSITGQLVNVKPAAICSRPPQLIDETLPPGRDHSWSDLAGRYVVWQESVRPAIFVGINGYDLGPDQFFNTQDDLGFFPLVPPGNQYGDITGASMRGADPQVNKNGVVAFAVIEYLSATQMEVRLYLCQFSSCQSTLTLVDSFPFVGWFPDGQYLVELGNDYLVYLRVDLKAQTDSVVSYDLKTKTKTVLYTQPHGQYPSLDLLMGLHTDPNNIVTFTRLIQQVGGPPTIEIYIAPIASSPSTVLVRRITDAKDPKQPPQVGGWIIITSFLYGNNLVFTFYIDVDSKGDYYDLYYVTYDLNTKIVSPPRAVIADDGYHQNNQEATYDPNNRMFVVAMRSTDSLGEHIQTVKYDPQSARFKKTETLSPFRVYDGIRPHGGIDGMNLLGLVYARDRTLPFRLFIVDTCNF